MAKMSDARIKKLVANAGDWVRESGERAKGGKVNIPKRPVKATGKKTVPSRLDWGKGVTKDKLAYINAEEEAMLKKRRGKTPVRKVNGVPAYAEETVGPGGSGGSSGKGGSGTGGSSAGSSSTSGGTGGSSAPSNSGSQDDKKTTSTGPSRGPTDAPAAVGPSKASTTPSAPPDSSFGPRSATGMAAKDPTQSAASQASKVAADAAMKAVSQGSIANPSTGTAPKSIDSRVPSAAQQSAGDMARSQSSKMSGTGDYSSLQGDITSGANSPMADAGVSSYDRTSYDKLNADAAANAAKIASNTGMVGPSVPAGTATANPTNFQSPMDKALQVAAAATTTKPITDRVPQGVAALPGPARPSLNPQTGLPMGEKITDRLPGTVDGPVNTGVPDPAGMTNMAMNNPPKSITDQVPQDPKFVDQHIYSDPTAPSVPTTEQTPGRTTSFGTKYANNSYTPGDYAKYHDTLAQTTLGNQMSDNVFNGSPAAPAASAAPAAASAGTISTPYGDITPGQLAQMTPADQARIKDWAANNQPATTRGLAAASTVPGLPSGMHQAAISQGLAPTTSPTTMASAAPIGDFRAPSTSPATPVAAAEPTRPYVDNNSPVEQMEPSSPYASKVQNMAAKVGNAVTPALNAVDDFLGRFLGSGNSSYKGQMANGADGSNGEIRPPWLNKGNPASASSGKAGNKASNPALPPLPPYVNYQSPPGTPGVGFELPPPSQPITDFIGGGYADGGAIKPLTNYGVHGVNGGLGAAAPAPAAQPAMAAQPAAAQTPGNPWGLDPIGGSGSGGGGGSNTPAPGDATDPTKAGGRPNKGNPDGIDWGKTQYGSFQNFFQQSLDNYVKSTLGGGSHAIWNPFLGMDAIAAGQRGGGGGGNGPHTGGNDPGTDGSGNDPHNNVDNLTGPGTPGAWSGTKTGWRRGGPVHDSASAALRLARGMHS